MYNRIADTWELLKPDGRSPSIWLAAQAIRLGADSLSSALRKVSQALRLEGKVPAVHRGEETFVRLALCPSIKSAVKTARHTAWCEEQYGRCKFLGEVGDGWVECKALPRAEGSAREGADYWWDFKNQTQTDKPKSTLTSLLKMLGPAALVGLSVWKAKEKQIDMLRKPPGTTNEQYNVIAAVLKARRLTFSYDTSKKVFQLPGASISLKPGGGAEFQDRQGRVMKATKKDMLTKLFEFVESI